MRLNLSGIVEGAEALQVDHRRPFDEVRSDHDAIEKPCAAWLRRGGGALVVGDVEKLRSLSSLGTRIVLGWVVAPGRIGPSKFAGRG